MKEYDRIQIQDICTRICSGGTPKSTVEEYYGGTIPWLNTKEVNFNRIHSTEKTITEKGLQNSSAKWIDENAVIVAMYGATAGKSAISKIPLTTNQACCNLNVDPNKADYRFVYYALYNDYNRLASLANGGAQQNLNAMQIKEFDIPYPSLKEQTIIADFLSALDDKIENNRQINDNLEQQASSLLSDWISTYPCRTYKLSDICKYANAKCETGNLTPQNYISTENMLPNKKGIVEASNIPTGKATCFKVDDILIANIRPYFQKIWKADINGGCSADVLCIRANIESHSPILYWLLHQDAFFEYVMTGAKGCKMPRGDKQHIMNWSIDLPEVQYWADLATQLGSIDQQIAYNRIESINLSNLRDTLLPKLMSGEIKINEIDC